MTTVTNEPKAANLYALRHERTGSYYLIDRGDTKHKFLRKVSHFIRNLFSKNYYGESGLKNLSARQTKVKVTEPRVMVFFSYENVGEPYRTQINDLAAKYRLLVFGAIPYKA